MSSEDVDAQRAESLERWERSAPGWGKRATRLRPAFMAVSAAMIDALSLQAGQRLLELAAGPGGVVVRPAERSPPGETLICGEGADGMRGVPRARAGEWGTNNFDFVRLEL